MGHRFDLDRFLLAQHHAYAQVVRELADGRKTGHWMWFVFPQLLGLGHSATAIQFAITSLDEARAYVAHPHLGPRLKDCVRLTLRIEGRSASDIFSAPDDLKFRSCMTLFDVASPQEPIFKEALQKFFGGSPDARTLELLLLQAR